MKPNCLEVEINSPFTEQAPSKLTTLGCSPISAISFSSLKSSFLSSTLAIPEKRNKIVMIIEGTSKSNNDYLQLINSIAQGFYDIQVIIKYIGKRYRSRQSQDYNGILIVILDINKHVFNGCFIIHIACLLSHQHYCLIKPLFKHYIEQKSIRTPKSTKKRDKKMFTQAKMKL